MAEIPETTTEGGTPEGDADKPARVARPARRPRRPMRYRERVANKTDSASSDPHSADALAAADDLGLTAAQWSEAARQMEDEASMARDDAAAEATAEEAAQADDGATDGDGTADGDDTDETRGFRRRVQPGPERRTPTRRPGRQKSRPLA
jgi:hypothetical protein